MCLAKNKGIKKGTYTENHHILPKSFWPQYKCFKENPWNKASLTTRQHFIAHMLLAYALGGKLWYAYFCMAKMNINGKRDSFYINSRLYERLKNEMSNITKDTKWINKDGKGLMVSESEYKTYMEDGWDIGRGISTTKGRICINKNGKVLKILHNDLNYYINDGWNIGMGYKNNLNKICVSDGNRDKMIEKAELESYLEMGWFRGRKDRNESPLKNKRRINNGKKMIYVDNSELEYYLKNGWETGVIKNLCPHCNESISVEFFKRHEKICKDRKNRKPKQNKRFTGGHHTKETRETIAQNSSGRKVYNNGYTEIRLLENDEIPKGFNRGRLKAKCKYCGFEAIITNIKRHHNENCKHK